MDFTVIKRADIRQGEFAEIVGVSRTTTNLWVRGKMHPHRYIRARIGVVLNHLEAALKHGALPLSKGTVDRVPAIRLAIKNAAQQAG